MGRKQDRTVFQRDDDKWVNKLNEAERASSIHDTQREAIQEAKRLLSDQGGGELTVKGRDGHIRSKDTIPPGNDPMPPRDKEH